jgi:hypothetical protein
MVCPNLTVQDILDELVYQTCFQWKTEDEITANEMSIRDEDVINIGKMAGVFQAFGWFVSNIGSIYFSRSFIANGTQRSERGLLNMDREVFEYTRLESDNYPTDILSESSAKKRITVVPKGIKPVGYVPMNTPLFDVNGNILWDNLLPEPPDTIPSVPFFGEAYLVFEEQFVKETTLTTPILKLLIECLQRVRFNGPSTALFLKITQVLGEGYMYDIAIIPRASYYEIQYKLNPNTIIDNHLRRYAVWQTVCKQKFKQFHLVQVTPV